MTVYVLMRCFGTEPGSVDAVVAFTSAAEADRECNLRNALQITKGEEVRDSYWVDPVNLVQVETMSDLRC